LTIMLVNVVAAFAAPLVSTGMRPATMATVALPMAIADYVAEAFETDALRGAIASRAVQYTAMGPWSAGTTAVLLADSAGNDGGAPGQSTIARGGPGAEFEDFPAAELAHGVSPGKTESLLRSPARREGRLADCIAALTHGWRSSSLGPGNVQPRGFPS